MHSILRFVPLLPLVFLVLSLIAAPTWAQSMNPDDPAAGDGDETKPAEPGDADSDGDGEGEMGPFHRPNPGHNPDSTMPARADQPPAFEEIVNALSKGLGFEGETAEAFRRILLEAQAAKVKAQQDHQQSRQGADPKQLEALGELFTPEQIVSIQTVFQGFERYRQQVGQLANMRRAGQLSQADHDDKRRQLDDLAMNFVRTNIPADGVEGFLQYFQAEVIGKANATGGEERLLDEIGKAYGLSIADRMKFKLIVRSRDRLQRRGDAGLQETMRAIEQKQSEQLQATLSADQMGRLAIVHQTSEGYKAAIRELRQLAGKPGVSRQDIAEQKAKIDKTVRDQFRELLVPEHYGTFMDVWERAIRSQMGG